MYQCGSRPALDVEKCRFLTEFRCQFSAGIKSFRIEDDFAVSATPSSKGVAVILQEREHSDLDVFDLVLLYGLSLQYPMQESLEQGFFQCLLNKSGVLLVEA